MGIIEEFKEFINRGNVMDMAVGVIIGAAFTGVVTALTDKIINPFITFITGGNGTEVGGLVVPGTSIDFGAFISAVINFLIVALCVFFIVKAFNAMKDGGSTLAKKVLRRDGEPETIEHPPTCPYCLEEVNAGATRCPHCCGEFDEPAEKTIEVVGAEVAEEVVAEA